MSLELSAHNFLFFLGGGINICVSLFVLYSTRRKWNMSIITFVLMTLAVANFEISHAFGVVAKSAEASRQILMFNMGDILIAVFMTHWFLELTGKTRDIKRKIILVGIYAVSYALLIFYLLHPQSFLLDSVPKLYFPFYYNPGPAYILMVLWFFIVGLYYFCELLASFIQAKDPVQKNRLRYVLLSILYAFTFGTTAFLLVFNIPVDPIISSLFGFYTIPLAYAMVRYELLDIKVLAKRALLYASIIFGVCVLVTGMNILTDHVYELYPNFPRWINYIATSFIMSGLGIFVYVKARESEILKYEFVTIITHKFRTPITHIMWAIDNMKTEHTLPTEVTSQLDVVQTSTLQLLELTNIIIQLNKAEGTAYANHFTDASLSKVVHDVAKNVASAFDHKGLTLNVELTQEPTIIRVDTEKVKVSLQQFFQNAIQYTPVPGTVTVKVQRVGNSAVFSITDTGIGISKSHVSNIFQKFYRTANARAAFTEGTGIGLYISKMILERNNGKVGVSSPGEGLGTTFTVSFPVV